MRLPGFSAIGSKAKTFVTPTLNLYPEDPFFDTLIGRAMKWAVGAGRHIIIFTELIVIVSFFSRFVLDRQLTDLNTSITQKQSIIESYGDLEASFRRAEQQENDISAILVQQGRLEIFDILSQITPPGVKYNSISLSGGNLSLVGKAGSLQTLIILVENTKRNPAFQRVSVGRLESGRNLDPTLDFTMNVLYTKGLVEFGGADGDAPPAAGSSGTSSGGSSSSGSGSSGGSGAESEAGV